MGLASRSPRADGHARGSNRMRSVTGTGERSPAASPVPPAADRVRLLTWLAAAGIAVSILVMIAASVLRNSWNSPRLVLPRAGPPWGLQSAYLSADAASVALWIAGLARGRGGDPRRGGLRAGG